MLFSHFLFNMPVMASSAKKYFGAVQEKIIWVNNILAPVH